MDKLLKGLNTLLNTLIVLVIASMVILVFLNVVLRYGFNSSITWSEEMGRILFVWVVFLGAVVAAKEKSHLGVDILTSKVPLGAQKVLYLFANLVFIIVMGLFIDGLLKMMELNSMVNTPAMGLPYNIFYAAGLFAAVLIIAISSLQTIRFVFFNQDPPPWVKSDNMTELAFKKGDEQL